MCASLTSQVTQPGAPLRPRRRGRRQGLFILAAGVVAATLCVGRPWVLANNTPSEPEGLYVGTLQLLAAGRIVAFTAPPGAFPYADGHLAYLRTTPLLKEIAAGPGDHVCTTGGRLKINGQDRAPIALADGEGRLLPRWRACRPLGQDEFFVFSDRVPNSFDSRYFGPVPRHAVIGVFALLTAARERR